MEISENNIEEQEDVMLLQPYCELENPERVILQEFPSAEPMSMPLMEKWGDGIPLYGECDPNNPEWRKTRAVRMDLRKYGYGEVTVKDEGDPESNPTRTIKDRPAWELATLYRDWARGLYLRMRCGEITRDDLCRTQIPRLSLITAGNEGRAIAEVFAKYNLPPPKLILDMKTPQERLEKLKKLHADIYLVDLSRRELTPRDIKALSNNSHGTDITSVKEIAPEAVFYDWQVHEVFNLVPQEIYVPHGTGRLFDNYLYWQRRTFNNAVSSAKDPRLNAPAVDVIGMHVFGAEPQTPDSIADKLTAKFKPFLIFKNEDVETAVNFLHTGKKTWIHKVLDEKIAEAHAIMLKHGIEAEPSAAAGLALYLMRYEKGLVNDRTRVVVVSTGIGI